MSYRIRVSDCDMRAPCAHLSAAANGSGSISGVRPIWPRPGRVRMLSLLLVVVWLPLLSAVDGQEAGTAETGPSNPPAAEKENVLNEQTIYIPYEKLRKVFEKEGRGVFLPYEKFQELWNAARAASRTERLPNGRSRP